MGGLSRLVLQHRAVSAVLAQRASLCTSSSRHEKTREFRKVMIANRGEIAIRVFRVVVLLRLAIPILPKKLGAWIIAKHVTKMLFWATVYLTFTYLTITSSFEVYQQYRNDQTTTNMKAKINNNVTYLPNMTICYKIKVKKLLEIHSTSSFNYTLAWSQFFEETISHEGVFKVNESQVYDDEIYLSLLKYLAMIYEAERAWEPGLTQISTFHSKKSDDWIALKKVLVPHIERLNITLEQLKSIFDGKFCPASASCGRRGRCTALLFLDYKPTYRPECIAGGKISFIGMKTICFRLVGYQNNMTLLGTTDYINLWQYDDGSYQKWCQEFTVDLGSESRSTPRRATTRNESYAHYYNRFTGVIKIYMNIGVKALYRKLPYVKGDIQCSSDTSQEECENKCYRGWIQANCHCSPITFSLTTDTSSYRNCTADDYSTCLKKYTENATYLCTNKCVPLCEQWHYEFGLESRTPEFYSSYVQIGLRTFDYIIIEQVFTWNSFEEFIGALGGALGLWLGLDFVIIIEFIVKVVTSLIKKISLRNVHNSKEDKQEESANMKQSEDDVENGISMSHETGSRVVGHQKEYKENESGIGGASIHKVNEKQSTSRKKRESNSLEEKHVQPRRKCSDNKLMGSTILDDKRTDIDANNGRLRNHKVNITNNVGTVQDKPTALAENSSARSWLIQKMLLLLLNGDASTNKQAVFLRLVEKLFWTAIYLVGSVFTTLWCVKLINLYLADEAVYYPSLIINRTVSLPPPSLCINRGSRLFFDIHGSISNTLMDYFGRSDINRTSFIQISGGKNWSEVLVSMGIFYFTVLAHSEISPDDVNFTSIYEWELDYSPFHYDNLSRNDIDESLHSIFLPKLLEWNITANELRQKLGAELARMTELKISFTNSSGTLDIVNETSFYTAAITKNFFCYSLSYAVNFTGPDDVLEYSFNKASCPQLHEAWSNFIIFTDFLLEPESDNYTFDDDDFLTVYDSTYYYIDYGKETRILINVDSLYTSRSEVKGEQRRSPNTTILYCHAQCRIELIEKLCNCSPIYWGMFISPTSGLDECTFDRYMGCLYFNASDDLDCKDSCLPFCTVSYFRSDKTYRELSQEHNETVVVRLSVKDGMYMTIEEKPIFTIDDLLTTV